VWFDVNHAIKELNLVSLMMKIGKWWKIAISFLRILKAPGITSDFQSLGLIISSYLSKKLLHL